MRLAPTAARRLPMIALALGLACAVMGQDKPPAEPALEPGPTCKVVRVVDGDTVVVELDGRPTSIRLIGVDAPETVAPGKPVERGGKAAAAFLREQLKGGTVRLEYEPARRRTDRFDRTLAYLRTVPDGTLVNLVIVEGGYGRAYTAKPFAMAERFRRAEQGAREAKLGLWAPDLPAAKVEASGAKAAAGQGGSTETETVFVTSTGERYHRSGCRYLVKSSLSRTLADLPARFTPCTKCDPPAR